jgi:hypothetical protein
LSWQDGEIALHEARRKARGPSGMRASPDREPRGEAGLGYFDVVLSPRGGHHGHSCKLSGEDGIGAF